MEENGYQEYTTMKNESESGNEVVKGVKSDLKQVISPTMRPPSKDER